MPAVIDDDTRAVSGGWSPVKVLAYTCRYVFSCQHARTHVHTPHARVSLQTAITDSHTQKHAATQCHYTHKHTHTGVLVHNAITHTHTHTYRRAGTQYHHTHTHTHTGVLVHNVRLCVCVCVCVCVMAKSTHVHKAARWL